MYLKTFFNFLVEREHQTQVKEMETKYQGEIDKLTESEAIHKAEAKELRILCEEL